jgi:hypothetical protein
MPEPPPTTPGVISLRDRRIDLAILAFFFINILFITYIVDLEQLVIANPNHFTYPIWPPAPMIDAIHWWGRTFDLLQQARPVWWKMTLWIDALGFGPFYVVAIYAFITGKNWIRLPSLLYSAVMLTNVTIILGEEYAGPYASPHFPVVFLANLPWLVFPLIIIARLWRSETPFSRTATAALPQPVAVSVKEAIK